ncbi:MAG: DUF2007 domain-containing protein [Polyangiaceae bacterium]|nr:DUF2007 domain-containing protein [Polyangiaceae bacterium]
MIPVYSAADWTDAELMRARLAERGLKVTLRNTFLQGALGELPANLAPEVCVFNEADARLARQWVEEFEGDQRADGPEQTCPHCGEKNPSNFELCWSCRQPLEPIGHES